MIVRRARAMLITGVVLLSLVSCGGNPQKSMYKAAMQAIEDASYGEAVEILTELGDYKDAPVQLQNAWYLYGIQLFELGELESAEAVFTYLDNYSDSAEKLDEVHFEMAEQLFFDGAYDLARDYYNQLPTAYTEKIQDRIRLIECAKVANAITAELQSDNNTLNFYMGMFGLDFDFDLHYEASDYTYYFDVYYAKGFSTLTSLLGSSMEDVTKNNQSSGMEKTIYLKFRDAGYDDIACEMRYFDYSGNFLYSFSYSGLDYQRDGGVQGSMEPMEIDDDIPGDTRANPYPSFGAEQDYLVTRMFEQTETMDWYKDDLTGSFMDDFAGIYINITAYRDNLGGVTYFLYYQTEDVTFEAVPSDHTEGSASGYHSVGFDLGKYFSGYNGVVEVMMTDSGKPLLYAVIPNCADTDGDYSSLRILED